MGGSSVAT
jgi:hypothetical protein